MGDPQLCGLATAPADDMAFVASKTVAGGVNPVCHLVGRALRRTYCNRHTARQAAT